MNITKIPAAKPFTFENVTINEPTVESFIQAERVSGQTEGYLFSIAVMSQCCVFDGQAQPAEELRKMRKCDFLALSSEINGDGAFPATGEEK